MTEQDPILSASRRPRPPLDAWAASLYEKHGLTGMSTAEDMEPVIKDLWSKSERSEAMEIALSRRIDARELERSDGLRAIYLLRNPDQAYGFLLVEMAFERQERERNATI